MNVAYNMDCMEYMKTLPDNAFDLAVVDPPYGINILEKTYATAQKPYGYMKAKRRDYRKHGNWDVKPERVYFEELFRVSKRQIVWGGNYFSDILPPSKGFICWDKRVNDAMTNDFADCEYAWLSSGMGVARIFRFCWNGMIQGNMRDKEERFHPTQKPVALYRWIYKNYAKQGDKILDTHLGSGSSRIAAWDAGLDFVGTEIDEQYFKMEEERFAKHIAQGRLFDNPLPSAEQTSLF